MAFRRIQLDLLRLSRHRIAPALMLLHLMGDRRRHRYDAGGLLATRPARTQASPDKSMTTACRNRMMYGGDGLRYAAKHLV